MWRMNLRHKEKRLTRTILFEDIAGGCSALSAAGLALDMNFWAMLTVLAIISDQILSQQGKEIA